MNEGEIRMQAELWALIAEIKAKDAIFESMKVTNKEMEFMHYPSVFGEEDFLKLNLEYLELANRLRSEI